MLALLSLLSAVWNKCCMEMLAEALPALRLAQEISWAGQAPSSFVEYTPPGLTT